MSEESQTNKTNTTPETLSTAPAKSDVIYETFSQKDISFVKETEVKKLSEEE